jgi:HD-GYP domain-containing protein (c-di-GMP phosphodiesterase class II)
MTDDSDVKLDSRHGQQLALALAAGLRTAGYYDPGNAVMKQACGVLSSLLAQCDADVGPVNIRVHSHCVFVDRTRLSCSVSTYARFALIMQLFEEWNINSLTFSPGMSDDELMRVLVLLARERPTETEGLSDLLASRGIQGVTAMMATPGTGRGSQGISPITVYSVAMQLGAELGGTSGPIQSGTVRRARHVTQAVVDEILRDPVSLLTLTSIKDFDSYLILHSTNVAVLSTVLGHRLGLSKSLLGELCLAGFLHDAGKLGVAPDVLNKPGKLDEAEWQQMRRHPIMASQALLNTRHLTSSNMRSVVVAFEHHLNYDLSGYPNTEIKKKVSLLGGIVSIADRFDAVTTARVYRKVNVTPPEAMVHIVEGSGRHFDPFLVKLFVEVMGIYPPGSVVVLSGGEAGVVCHPPAVGTPLDRPSVRVIVGGEPGTVIDLQERAGDSYARDIIGVLNPSNKGQIPAVDPALFESV